jgi:hypothetical protein
MVDMRDDGEIADVCDRVGGHGGRRGAFARWPSMELTRHSSAGRGKEPLGAAWLALVFDHAGSVKLRARRRFGAGSAGSAVDLALRRGSGELTIPFRRGLAFAV